jgi:hypothetical protein
MKNKLFFLFLIMLFCSTAFALTTTTTNPSGGVYNGGFENGTGSATIASWIGDKNYGWYLGGSTFYSGYDSTIFYSGLQSIRLDTNSTSRYITNVRTTTTGALTDVYSLIKVKPSTKYRVSGWIN